MDRGFYRSCAAAAFWIRRYNVINAGASLVSLLVIVSAMPSCGGRFGSSDTPPVPPIASLESSTEGSAAFAMKKAMEKASTQVILVAAVNDKMADYAGLMKEITDFIRDPKYSGITEVIRVDPRVESEKAFIGQFGIPGAPEKPFTVVMAAPWQILGVIQGPVTSIRIQRLVDAHRARVPGGSKAPACPT